MKHLVILVMRMAEPELNLFSTPMLEIILNETKEKLIEMFSQFSHILSHIFSLIQIIDIQIISIYIYIYIASIL